MVNLPFISDVIPVAEFLILMVTPGSGCPLSSVIVPVMVSAAGLFDIEIIVLKEL
jgi:hypothetical protein